MSSTDRPSLATKHKAALAESRLREALLKCPRSLFCTHEPEHEGELREAPGDLTVVTMLEALELTGTERVLDLDSDSAYAAALLGHLAAEVYSVVAEPELAERRSRELSALGYRNVHVALAGSAAGWPAAAPYQAILVGAATLEVPLELVHQLDLGGRLVIPIGDAKSQLLERLRKRQGAVDSETLGACHLSLLPSAEPSQTVVPWADPARG